MKRGRQVASVALVVLFAFFAYESLQLSLSDVIGPGAGFFPFWLSVLGSILGSILLVQLKLGRAELTGEFTFEREGTRNVVLMLAGLIVAAVLLEVLGFSVSMLLLVVYLLLALHAKNRLARSRSWRSPAASASITFPTISSSCHYRPASWAARGGACLRLGPRRRRTEGSPWFPSVTSFPSCVSDK